MGLTEKTGRAFRVWRESLGFTRSEVAEHTEVSRSQVGLIETGQSGTRVGTLEDLAKAIGIVCVIRFEESEQDVPDSFALRTIPPGRRAFAQRLFAALSEIPEHDFRVIERMVNGMIRPD